MEATLFLTLSCCCDADCGGGGGGGGGDDGGDGGGGVDAEGGEAPGDERRPMLEPSLSSSLSSSSISPSIICLYSSRCLRSMWSASILRVVKRRSQKRQISIGSIIGQYSSSDNDSLFDNESDFDSSSNDESSFAFFGGGASTSSSSSSSLNVITSIFRFDSSDVGFGDVAIGVGEDCSCGVLGGVDGCTGDVIGVGVVILLSDGCGDPDTDGSDGRGDVAKRASTSLKESGVFGGEGGGSVVCRDWPS